MHSSQYINPYKPQHPYSLSNKQRLFLKKWEKQRDMPRVMYFLINGFLKKISWVFIILKAVQFIFFNEQSTNFYITGFGVFFLLTEFFFWVFCGLILGWMQYTEKESEYELFKSMRHF
jgi:hypothetical protein